MYVILGYRKNTYEVIRLKEKNNKEALDENFFRAMSYELAGEIGVLDNEDMKNNRKLINKPNKEKSEKNNK